MEGYKGYAKVAALMARYDELAILRGFKALNIQNLLYLQAEIIHLEDKLKELVKTDAGHPDREYHSKDWWALAHGEGKGGKAQWKQARKIRKKLAKYSETAFDSCLSRPGSVSNTPKMTLYSSRWSSPSYKGPILSTSLFSDNGSRGHSGVLSRSEALI